MLTKLLSITLLCLIVAFLGACAAGRLDGAHLATATPCPHPSLTTAAAPTRAVENEADAYLEEALGHIHRHAVRQERVTPWWAFRDNVFAAAGRPQVISDTYPAIRLAASQLCDNHSFFMEPAEAGRLEQGSQAGFGLTVIYPEGVVIEALPGSPATAAGVRLGDVVEQVNGRPPVSFVDRPFVALNGSEPVTLSLRRGLVVTLQPAGHPANPRPTGRRLDGGIGYLELTRFTGEGEAASQYAAEVQQLIAGLETTPVCGWVVDLRRNSGGNLWPMLLGAAPLLGAGWVGSLVDAEGTVTRWMLRPDDLRLDGQVIVEIEEGYRLAQPEPPVAVLTSRITGSAGEGVVVAFLGRENSRLFGEWTAGVASANRARELSDGALLFVTTAFFADTAGQVYDGKIVPDETIPVDWQRFGADEDPVLQAAVAWLKGQPACL
ncbi:MAG: S41 family peptidase [Chloroflexi bacterium]|nr:S41 family peptidase [Chloroflexota bacterium]MCI0577737.1 S41 family peptidase [Chloroflexota bacterium]MCI0732000.1 S41 family peptidase [Chloroflexota bacterium]